MPPYDTTRIVRALREHAPVCGATEPHLREAIGDAAARPGGLVRARLVLVAAERHGLGQEAAEELACAVEYFHLASLILDDLPCMDDAATRRGHACTHRVHGEATAILTALAFINRAYALAHGAFAFLPAGIRLAAGACLDACLGTAGLVGGQALDLRFAETPRDLRTVGIVALRKTSALFWLAVVLPSLPSAPGPAEIRRLKAVCVYWGLAYQAADDLHDVLASPASSGKSTGRDRALHRPNLALAAGVPAARRRLTRLSRLAGEAVTALVHSSSRWDYLAAFHRESFATTMLPFTVDRVTRAA
jgi:geranylgeranyl diphosphate synthase, type II